MDFDGQLGSELTMLSVLQGIIKEEKPDGVPIPLMLAGFTDGCQFSKLGIQDYGFLPAAMPPGFNWERAIHSTDERIPVEALDFGVRAMYKTLIQFGA